MCISGLVKSIAPPSSPIDSSDIDTCRCFVLFLELDIAKNKNMLGIFYCIQAWWGWHPTVPRVPRTTVFLMNTIHTGEDSKNWKKKVNGRALRTIKLSFGQSKKKAKFHFLVIKLRKSNKFLTLEMGTGVFFDPGGIKCVIIF